MKKLSSWILAMFMVMFWGFRIIVALYEEDGFAGFVAFNLRLEIILLFVTIVSFILIVRRNILGAILYLVSYGFYFGGYIVKTVLPLLMDGSSLGFDIIQNFVVALIGVVIALLTFFDVFFEKMVKRKYSDNKTDWFFNNKNTDRQLDEKADKNQYKIY